MKGFDREVASLAIKSSRAIAVRRHLTRPPCTVECACHTVLRIYDFFPFSPQIDPSSMNLRTFTFDLTPPYMRKQSVGGLGDYCSRFEAWKENVAYSQRMPSLLDDRCASSAQQCTVQYWRHHILVSLTDSFGQVNGPLQRALGSQLANTPDGGSSSISAQSVASRSKASHLARNPNCSSAGTGELVSCPSQGRTAPAHSAGH